jgi:hypothetical protein
MMKRLLFLLGPLSLPQSAVSAGPLFGSRKVVEVKPVAAVIGATAAVPKSVEDTEIAVN